MVGPSQWGRCGARACGGAEPAGGRAGCVGLSCPRVSSVTRGGSGGESLVAPRTAWGAPRIVQQHQGWLWRGLRRCERRLCQALRASGSAESCSGGLRRHEGWLCTSPAVRVAARAGPGGLRRHQGRLPEPPAPRGAPLRRCAPRPSAAPPAAGSASAPGTGGGSRPGRASAPAPSPRGPRRGLRRAPPTPG